MEELTNFVGPKRSSRICEVYDRNKGVPSARPFVVRKIIVMQSYISSLKDDTTVMPKIATFKAVKPV